MKKIIGIGEDSAIKIKHTESLLVKEETYKLGNQRVIELNKALEKRSSGQDHWALDGFLASAYGIDELEDMKKYLEGHKIEYNKKVFDAIRKTIGIYEDFENKFPNFFEVHYPLLAPKLDTPQKRQIFLRAAHLHCGEHDLVGQVCELANIVEEILKTHEVDGKNYIEIDCTRKLYMLSIHRQLTQLIFPNIKMFGAQTVGKNYTAFFDWREEEN